MTVRIDWPNISETTHKSCSPGQLMLSNPVMADSHNQEPSEMLLKLLYMPDILFFSSTMKN